MTDAPDVPQVVSVTLDGDLIERATSQSDALVVLPDRVVDGKGIYPQAALTTVKRLRAAGVEARYLDPPESRLFEVKNGVVLVEVVSFVLGIGANAAWDGIKALLRRRASPPPSAEAPAPELSITYVELQEGNELRGTAWKAEGDTEGVLAAIDKFRGGGPESPAELTDLMAGELPEAPALALTSLQADGSDDDLHAAYLSERISEPRDEADRLIEHARQLLADDPSEDELVEAESTSAGALALYRSSLNWAEDTDQEDDAHRALDEAGRFVREAFGCYLEHDGPNYRRTCPVDLGHNRLGLSIGGAASRTCSLCGEDLSECEHLPGTAYLVPGGTDELGWCRVCSEEECFEHSPDQLYRTRVITIIQEVGFVDEVSLVNKPAQPDARILSISLSAADLQATLGEDFEPGMEVSCDKCLSPCGGLIRHED